MNRFFFFFFFFFFLTFPFLVILYTVGLLQKCYFAASSPSVQWRRKGSEHYKVAAKEGLSPTVREERLKKAIHDYDRALNTAQGG